MTLLAISIAVHDTDEISQAIGRAAKAVQGGANIVEWRIDGLGDHESPLPALLRLVRESPAPCIVTCRPTREGGEYQGDEPTRASLFRSLLESEYKPRYIDIELAAFQQSTFIRQAVNAPQTGDLTTSFIFSVHDFNGRPPHLLQQIEAMVHEPACSVMKLAWHARSLRDNLEAFELLSNRRKPMIAICMGQFGLLSRVLAPKFGGFLSFVTDVEAEVTGPGQPTLEEISDLYRFKRITGKTKVFGVIGWPVQHSMSPKIHNAGFAEVVFDGVYLPLPIPPEYEHFKATVGSLIDSVGLEFRGASVTLPHKEHLVRFVRERVGRIDSLTERIGAANTLMVGSAGGMECLNTDCPAAISSLADGMGISPQKLTGMKIAVLGAGGLARAVVVGLLALGVDVTVFNRNADRAMMLVDELLSDDGGGSGRLHSGTPDELANGRFDVIINCTSVGMHGGSAPDDSPLPQEAKLNSSVTVFDTVYTPPRTPLIRQAEAAGARVITGVDMFVRQAAMQFERWTGREAPLGIMASMIASKGDH